MDVEPLQLSNIAYTISGTILREQAEGPIIAYWIHVINEDGVVIDSDKYIIGVKPDYSVKGKIEIVSDKNVPGSTTFRPDIFLTNEADGPIFGNISLIINNKTVATYPSELFDEGESTFGFDWKLPKTNKLTTQEVKVRAEFYDTVFESESDVLVFPPTRIVSLSQPQMIRPITDSDGNVVAYPSVLYSSFRHDENLRYRVIAPDGTCVIGGSAECIVSESTSGQRGHVISTTINEQIYRIEYSGSEASLERFIISSIDPISGLWKVQIETETGKVQQDVMKDVNLKIKYRAMTTP